jgi:uncharacterized delta-60 repeat protein
MTRLGKGRSRLVGALCLASTLAATVGVAALAAPGDLDRTFSGDGKLTTNFTRGDDVASGVVIQPDGKIVATGYAIRNRWWFTFARYRADGSLDRSFGGDGRVRVDFGDPSYASDLALQADGKIVAAGVVWPTENQFALARLNSDGTLDPTFDGDGKTTSAFPPYVEAAASSVVVQADGKIVVGGTVTSSDGTPDFALARYDPDGTLDASFGEDGWVTTDISDRDSGRAVALQADGKIVLAGGVGGRLSSTAEFALVRYQADGTLDSTFGDGGKVTTDFRKYDSAYDIAIQANGKIIAVGRAGWKWGLARYNPDGTLDASFGDGGKVLTNFGSAVDVASSVAIQATGKIVVAGRRGVRFFALARYRPSGALDRTFSGDGKVTATFGDHLAVANDVAVQANGRIVSAGRAVWSISNSRFALIRYRGG